MLRQKYKQINVRTKLLVLGLLTLIAVALSIRFNYSIPIVVLVIVSIAVSGHMILTKPKTTLSVIVCLLQALFIAYASFFFGTVFGSIGLDSTLFLVLTMLMFTAGSALITYIVFIFSKGRVWVSLTLSFLALDISGFIIGGSGGLNYVLSLAIAIILGLLVAIVRSFKIFKRKPKNLERVQETISKIRNANAALTAEKLFMKENWNYIDIDNNKKSFLVDTGKTLMIVFPAGFTNIITKDKKDLFYGEVSLGNLFGTMLDEAQDITIETKIPNKNISIVVLDVLNKYPKQKPGYSEMFLSPKKDSRDIEQNIVIASNQGLKEYNNSLPTFKNVYNKQFLKYVNEKTN